MKKELKKWVLQPWEQLESGKIGYALLWLLGVPLPILAIAYFFRES